MPSKVLPSSAARDAIAGSAVPTMRSGGTNSEGICQSIDMTVPPERRSIDHRCPPSAVQRREHRTARCALGLSAILRMRRRKDRLASVDRGSYDALHIPRPTPVLSEAAMNDQAVTTLEQTLRGRLVRPTDADYDSVRALYNGMIDKRPSLIARAVDAADVIAAVNFAREQGLLLAIRGGGHNGPGLGSCDDGLVIDLSMMRSVRVDPARRSVRVDAGCTSGDVDHATHAFGLAVPFGIVSTTGVAGLTLGGGTGYLTRKYGLTIDNLLEADVVLADGRCVTTSQSEHPDLFWALRGGGGNFGVVTSFLFQAHPVDTVYAGPIFWEATNARAVMRAYTDFLPTAPEELGAFVGLKTVPSLDPFPKEYWGRRACAVISSYNGPAEEGAK